MSAGLPTEVRDLLAAVVEALDVPLPDITDAAERQHYRLVQRRAADVHVTLAVLLESGATDLTHDAQVIRTRTAETPVTYPVWDGGQS